MKTENTISLVVALALTGLFFGVHWKKHQERVRLEKIEAAQTNMPPGYALACDGKGYYALVRPSGSVWDYTDEVSTNKLFVIKRAWHWHFIDTNSVNVAPLRRDGAWTVCE